MSQWFGLKDRLVKRDVPNVKMVLIQFNENSLPAHTPKKLFDSWFCFLVISNHWLSTIEYVRLAPPTASHSAYSLCIVMMSEIFHRLFSAQWSRSYLGNIHNKIYSICMQGLSFLCVIGSLHQFGHPQLLFVCGGVCLLAAEIRNLEHEAVGSSINKRMTVNKLYL